MHQSSTNICVFKAFVSVGLKTNHEKLFPRETRLKMDLQYVMYGLNKTLGWHRFQIIYYQILTLV